MEFVLLMKMLWSIVALAAAFIGLGCAAEGDYFSIIAEVGYWADGLVCGKKFVLTKEVRLNVDADKDCVLKATVVHGNTEWECEAQPRGTCGKPGIAVKKTNFPLKAKLDYFRFFHPKGAAETVICPHHTTQMFKKLTRPVYFTNFDEDKLENDYQDVLRLVTRRPILGMIKNDAKDEVRPWVTLPFDVLKRNCVGCLISGEVGNGQERKFSFRVPIAPSANLPEVWQFQSDYKMLKRVDNGDEEDTVRRGANLFKKHGGLCVLAMPKSTCLPSFKGSSAGICFRAKRFKSASSMPYNCVAAIAPSKNGKLTGTLVTRPVFSKSGGGGLMLARSANPLYSRPAGEKEDDPTEAILDVIAT